jgi:alkylated DNA repair dioxygenase AlkB
MALGAMRGVPERPAGLTYIPELLDATGHDALVSAVDGLDYYEVRMRDQVARRTVRHFGYRYAYETYELVPTDPLPDELRNVRERCAQAADIAPDDLAQTLVTRYPPGATIGWHRDAPMFGPAVVGVSLLSACVMRFQRRVGGERRVYQQLLEPASGYVLAGAARATWQHSIPAVSELRYSITFRTLRRRSGRPPSAGSTNSA